MLSGCSPENLKSALNLPSRPEPGTIVTQEGYPRSYADDQNAPTWTTQYEVTATEVKGTPYHPNGFLYPKTVTLPRSEFKLIFQPKDVVAAMHIPFGGGLTPQKARESLAAVKPFFDTYFPEMSRGKDRGEGRAGPR